MEVYDMLILWEKINKNEIQLDEEEQRMTFGMAEILTQFKEAR